MLEKITSHQEDILTFLRKEAYFNLFLIADIEQFGWETDFQEVWVQRDESGKTVAVMMRFYHRLMISSNFSEKNNLSFTEIKQYIEENSGITSVSARLEMIQNMEKTLSFDSARDMLFYKLENPTVRKEPVKNVFRIEYVTVDNLEQAIELRGKVQEFERSGIEENVLRNGIIKGTVKTLLIQESDKPVAMASIVAESSQAGMLGGVCTHPDYRGKGYASALVHQLCTDLFQRKKAVCLFCDNPAAGRIYERIGFQPIGILRIGNIDQVR